MGKLLRGTVSMSETRRVTAMVSAKTLEDLKTLERLTSQKKALDLEIKRLHGGITERFDRFDPEALDAGVKFQGGYAVKRVSGHGSKFNKKLFVCLGGDLGVYNESMVPFDKKAYQIGRASCRERV